MAKRGAIRFFVDQNVPDSVGTTLRKYGHDVTLLREVIPTESPDPLVAATAQSYRAVLVSFDRDFDAKRAAVQIGRREEKLSRVILKCREPEAANRIEVAMTLIESEYRIFRKKDSGLKRMYVEVQGGAIRTHR